MPSAGTKPITIVVDTREQDDYTFSLPTTRHALPAGDYSLAGMEQEVAVERKSLSDFVRTVIKDRDRFRRELRKLQDYAAACVVVEATLEDVLRGTYTSGAHPNAVTGAAMSIIVDYGIPVFFCSNRQCAREFTERFLLRYSQKIQRQREEREGRA